ncbi:hypothetical protein BV20DRAFT_1050638 [Pilatotrama ljubarskyi]|nr:hypothetical protein BV20DRAFT_1050638 [Pilatotrama ljubarskyi]
MATASYDEPGPDTYTYRGSPTLSAHRRPLPTVRQAAESLDVLARDARRHAKSGWVCAGPEGLPVSEFDRLMYEMMSEEELHEVGEWFQEAVRQRFFDSKVRVPVDDTDVPVYVVYRGARNGPGIYRTWEEVVPAVLGLHGSLYQKCTSWCEVASRVVQALLVGGILSHIPDGARSPSGYEMWLSALTRSPYARLYASPDLLPISSLGVPGSMLPQREAFQEGLVDWKVLDVSKKPPLAPETPAFRPLAPPPTHAARASFLRPQASSSNLRHRSSSSHLLGTSSRSTRSPSPRPIETPTVLRSPSPHPFASSLRERQAPSLSAVGVDGPNGLPTTASPRPAAHPVERTGFYAVYRGRAPWIYCTE